MDHRVSGAIITASECTALLAAFVIVLSMLGVNVNALLLPAGIALAYAAKDLSHNFLAGRPHYAYAWPYLSSKMLSFQSPPRAKRLQLFRGASNMFGPAVLSFSLSGAYLPLSQKGCSHQVLQDLLSSDRRLCVRRILLVCGAAL